VSALEQASVTKHYKPAAPLPSVSPGRLERGDSGDTLTGGDGNDVLNGDAGNETSTAATVSTG
jgi:hypothetical protein